jgi:alpha-beta hydrolase superfamily lysophospholipase
VLLCCVLFAAGGTAVGWGTPRAQQVSIDEEVVSLKAEDGGGSWGVLYTPGDRAAATAVLAMHPRGDQSRHFFLRPLAEAGFAAFGHNNRYVNNDTDGIHEEMLLDVAAGVRFLRERGFKRVVLLAISGGGSLMAFYQAQAVTAPPGRVQATPAGDPPDLNKFDLPVADGLLMVIPHLGEGLILEARIDPAVVNEGDPLSVDGSLDMYDPANGFRTPPEVTRYTPEFVERYRGGQRERMRRLDAWARELLAEEDHFRRLRDDPSFAQRPASERQWIERGANALRMMTIYRTWADPRYMDLMLDPSDRVVGNNEGTTPWIANYGSTPNPALITPRAFLSSRSAFSSNAVTERNLPLVKVPTAIIQGTAHRAIYPNDTRAIYKAAGAADKELIWIEGADVSFRPSGPKAGSGRQREEAIGAAIAWLKKRFP